MKLRCLVSATTVAASSGLVLAKLPPSTAALRGGVAYMQSGAVAENPLLEQSGLPRFDVLDATHVRPGVEQTLSTLEKEFSELEEKLQANSAPGYDDVIVEMEKLEAPVEYVWGVVGHLMGVKNSDELRDAHGEMQPAVIQTTTKLSQSAAVFTALEQVQEGAADALDPAQKRIVDASLKAMRLSGVALEGAEKEAFNANRMALAELSTKFSNQLLDATKAYSLTLTDKADVEGLPPSALALAASRAVEAGEAGATAESGPWKMGLDMPSYLPSMKFLKKRSVREQLYRAFVTRAGDENAPLISEILELRQKQARILGYETHAEVSLERKMAEGVGAVDELTEMLLSKAMPAAQRELAELSAFAKAGGFGGDSLALWDVPYWSERQSEQKFGFEEEELRPYFALPNVLDGLFALTKRIFGVDIIEATSEAPLWHPDVQFFHVHDEATQEHIASFYLDPYARPENKRGGAWMDVCVGKSSVLGRIPVAYLTCNGSPPVDGKPSLMTFSEVRRRAAASPWERGWLRWLHRTVARSSSLPGTCPPFPCSSLPLSCAGPARPTAPVRLRPPPSPVRLRPPTAPSRLRPPPSQVTTLFHETGHGLQHMLTTVAHKPAAGIEGVEWDAVELPSQFMENFCYDEATLYGMAKHYDTNEPLPKELYHKLCEQKTYQAGMTMVRQLFFGALDISLHHTYDPQGDKTPFELQHELAQRFTVIPPLPEDRFLCGFGHIFAGGYAAGYYSYKWAEVLSADAFAAFEEVGLDNDAAVREVGRRFRDTVLSLGGGTHPSEVFRAFRGRDPSPEPLLRHSGLLD